MQDTRRTLCHHIHAAGNPCGSPALRGEEFCYFHHPTRRPRRPRGRKPRPPAFHLPSFDDRNSIQRALAKIVSRVVSRRLDRERARLLLVILRLANQTLPGDSRSLEGLIEQAQTNLGLTEFDLLADLLKEIRRPSHKKCTGSRPNRP